MKRILLLIFCVLQISFVQTLSAQTEEEKALNPKYVLLDIAGVREVARLKPIESYTLPQLEKKFLSIKAYTTWKDETNLGFGAKRIKLSAGLGYVRAYVDLLVFGNKIAYYELALDGSSEWPRDEVLSEWKKNGGIPLEETDKKFFLKKNFDDVWTSYKRAIAHYLGPVRPVNIEPEFRRAYSLLTDPLENSTITDGGCDDGRDAINVLEKGKRIDVIQNVLRAYNPGGRIYAAISLLRMKKKGIKLSRSTQVAIRRVVYLDAEASTCWGHVGTTGLRARDIIREFVNSETW
jgi:hypothetical protein